MTTMMRRVLLAGGLTFAIGVLPASAQIHEAVTFKTTFPFSVGRATLPAGSYTVRPASERDAGLMEISGKHGSALFFVEDAGAPRTDPNENVAVFNHSGDHYVLAQIWDEADREGAETLTAAAAEPRKGDRDQTRR